MNNIQRTGSIPVVLLALAAALLSRGDTVKYRYDEAGRLVRVTSGSGKTITYIYDNAGNLVKRDVTFALASPVVNAGGTLNGASFKTPLAAGSIASLFGSNVGATTVFGSTLPLRSTLLGTTVKLNGIAAPLFYVSPLQINFQVPWELAGQTQAALTVDVAGLASASQTVSLAAAAPGIFSTNSQGTGQGAIQIANTTIFAAPEGSIPGAQARPARKGEFLTIYCTGLGDVTNRPASGAAALGDPLSTTRATPTVTLGGVPATVAFSGLSPGFVGLYQVNVQVPDNAPADNNVSVEITIAGEKSNTVTIAVQ